VEDAPLSLDSPPQATRPKPTRAARIIVVEVLRLGMGHLSLIEEAVQKREIIAPVGPRFLKEWTCD
jgi:hypothetical protein